MVFCKGKRIFISWLRFKYRALYPCILLMNSIMIFVFIILNSHTAFLCNSLFLYIIWFKLQLRLKFIPSPCNDFHKCSLAGTRTRSCKPVRFLSSTQKRRSRRVFSQQISRHRKSCYISQCDKSFSFHFNFDFYLVSHTQSKKLSSRLWWTSLSDWLLTLTFLRHYQREWKGNIELVWSCFLSRSNANYTLFYLSRWRGACAFITDSL